MADVKKIATRESYGNALVELGKKYDNVVVLDADLAAATKTGVFKKAFPERHFDCGIAECNMVDVAAGLSTMGRCPLPALSPCSPPAAPLSRSATPWAILTIMSRSALPTAVSAWARTAPAISAAKILP